MKNLLKYANVNALQVTMLIIPFVALFFVGVILII